MSDHHEDELAPTQTTGYKPGEKKSLQEYQNLDAQDESLKKWKESLGLRNTAYATGASYDSPKVVVELLSLEFEGREDIIIVDFSAPITFAHSHTPFTIKEGAEYCVKVKFRVQHDVFMLKYSQLVKRSGIKIDKDEELFGNYRPSADSYEIKLCPQETPSARGHYIVQSRLIDDDEAIYMDWSWSFDTKEDC